jgi:hypothetical protein
MRRILILLLISLLAWGCGEDGTKTIILNQSRIKTFSTEMLPACWFNENTLQQKVVRSGAFASRIDSVNSYSYGFKSFFAQLDSTIPRRINISLWLRAQDMDIDADLVVSIDSTDKNKFWAAVALKDSLKKSDTWQQIQCKLTLPKRVIRPEDKVIVYVWGKNAKEIFIDDLSVAFEY